MFSCAGLLFKFRQFSVSGSKHVIGCIKCCHAICCHDQDCCSNIDRFHCSYMSNAQTCGNQNASVHSPGEDECMHVMNSSEINTGSDTKVDNSAEPARTLDSYFDTSPRFSKQERSSLSELLHQHTYSCVTPECPKLTTLFQHKIMLKPDPVPKNKTPCRVSPDKREVLRHQVDELLSRGIITPVSEKEDLHITSPIVLVSKRCRDPSKVQVLLAKRVCLNTDFVATFYI